VALPPDTRILPALLGAAHVGLRPAFSTKMKASRPASPAAPAAATDPGQPQLPEIEERLREVEELLARKTAELDAANKELETFAHSVSHDLRAPLRAIDGFSGILLEDFGERLGPEGQAPLRRIRAAAQRMGNLIDDLSKLALVSRSEMRRETIDLSALVREAVRQAREKEPDRSVTVDVAEGAVVRGNPRLLAIALGHLIGNAFKFTSKRADARIAFGVDRRPDGPVYFVRDNGVGFDMRYADKLFGPFQRFHSASDFRGTGIGLATVQRILHRHGGSVWAAAEVGHGATFSFRL